MCLRTVKSISITDKSENIFVYICKSDVNKYLCLILKCISFSIFSLKLYIAVIFLSVFYVIPKSLFV